MLPCRLECVRWCLVLGGPQFINCFQSPFWRLIFLGGSFGPFGHPWPRAIPPSSLCPNCVVFMYREGLPSCLSQQRAKASSRREHLDTAEALPTQVPVALCSTVCITLLSLFFVLLIYLAQHKRRKIKRWYIYLPLLPPAYGREGCNLSGLENPLSRIMTV